MEIIGNELAIFKYFKVQKKPKNIYPQWLMQSIRFTPTAPAGSGKVGCDAPRAPPVANRRVLTSHTPDAGPKALRLAPQLQHVKEPPPACVPVPHRGDPTPAESRRRPAPNGTDAPPEGASSPDDPATLALHRHFVNTYYILQGGPPGPVLPRRQSRHGAAQTDAFSPGGPAAAPAPPSARSSRATSRARPGTAEQHEPPKIHRPWVVPPPPRRQPAPAAQKQQRHHEIHRELMHQPEDRRKREAYQLLLPQYHRRRHPAHFDEPRKPKVLPSVSNGMVAPTLMFH